jgi:hypothetical protein
MIMAQHEQGPGEETAVDDVRKVRIAIAEQHGGNLREHMEETNRLFEQMRERLNLGAVVPPPERARGQ